MAHAKGPETNVAKFNISNVHVSIVTPLYNSAAFIADTICSVQAQTHRNWEMIIVDDCSSDHGAKIVRSYADNDKRIKLVSLKENCGAAVARNKAIEVASGDFIAFLDSDDLWKPKKLEKQLSFMISNNYSFSFTSYEIMDDGGTSLQKIIKADKLITYKKVLRRNPIGCLTAIYSVNTLGKIYMPLIRKRQDQGLWLKILRDGTIAYGLNDPLAIYRLRKDSISSNKLDLVKYQWQLYRDIENLGLLKSLFYLIAVTYNKLIRF